MGEQFSPGLGEIDINDDEHKVFDNRCGEAGPRAANNILCPLSEVFPSQFCFYEVQNS